MGNRDLNGGYTWGVACIQGRTEPTSVEVGCSPLPQSIFVGGAAPVDCTLQISGSHIYIEGDGHQLSVLGNENKILVHGSNNNLRLEGSNNALLDLQSHGRNVSIYLDQGRNPHLVTGLVNNKLQIARHSLEDDTGNVVSDAPKLLEGSRGVALIQLVSNQSNNTNPAAHVRCTWQPRRANFGSQGSNNGAEDAAPDNDSGFRNPSNLGNHLSGILTMNSYSWRFRFLRVPQSPETLKEGCSVEGVCSRNGPETVFVGGPFPLDCTLQICGAHIYIEEDEHRVSILGVNNTIVVNGSNVILRLDLNNNNVRANGGGMTLYLDGDVPVGENPQNITRRSLKDAAGNVVADAPKLLPGNHGLARIQELSSHSNDAGTDTPTHIRCSWKLRQDKPMNLGGGGDETSNSILPSNCPSGGSNGSSVKRSHEEDGGDDAESNKRANESQ